MPASDTPQKLLKIRLKTLGWRRRDLAKRAGFTLPTTKLMACGFGLSRKGQHRIERAVQWPIWSTRQEFDRRAAIIEWGGFDPWIATVKETVAKGRLRGIEFPFRASRPQAEQAISAAFAAAKTNSNQPN